MSMDAVAALHVTLDEAKKILGDAEDSRPGASLSGADGVAFRVRALDDGLLVFMGTSLREAEPEQLAILLRARLGDVLDAHDDDRGVMVFPERARPSATRYADVVGELGDLGEWIDPTVDEVAAAEPPAMGGIEALVGQMMGDPSQMQGLWEQAQRMMADPAMQQQLMAAAAQMMAGSPSPAGGGPQADLGGLDVGAITAQAQALLDQDPELARRLEEQLGLHDDEDDDPGQG